MTPPSPLTALIISLEAQRYAAMQQADLQGFANLCHATLVYVHSNGVQDTLERYLEKCRQGLYVYHHIEHQVREVRLCGDIALVFGEMTARITSHGVNKTLHNRTLSAWLNTDGRWQLSAYQPTPIQQRPAPTTGDQPHAHP